MILSAGQPYFAPYAGFFHKILLSDTFVVLDAVQFPRGTTWISRNRFKNDQGTLWMTVPVWKKGLGLQAIDAVGISHEGRWAQKHLQSLKSAYANAPYFADHLPFMAELFSTKFEKLLDLNLTIIRHVMRSLEIDTRVVLLSDLNVRARGSRLPVEICRHAGASMYLAQGPARKYLDPQVFEQAGVELRFFSLRTPIYPQLWGPFIPNLSVFDLLFNCGAKAREIITAHAVDL